MPDKKLDVKPEVSPVPHEDIVESTNIVTAVQKPGSPLETRQDREANEVYRKDQANLADTDVPHSGLVIETADPVVNLNTRDNIVPSGPGSVEDFIVTD